MAASNEDLLTLAKEEYKKRVKALNVTEIEEKIYQSQEYIQASVEKKNQYLANKIFRPIVKQYLDDPKKWLEEIQKICGNKWDLRISVSDFDRKRMKHMVGPKIAVGELLEVSFLIKGEERAVVYGYTECQKYNLDSVAVKDYTINIVDLPSFFAGLYQYQEIMEECQRLRGLSAEERKNDIGYICVMEMFQKYPLDTFVQTAKERETYRQSCIEKAYAYKKKNKRKRFHYNTHLLVAQCLGKAEMNTYFYCLFQQVMEGEIPLLSYQDMVDYSLEEKSGWKTMTRLGSLSFWGELLNARASLRGTAIANYNSYKDLDSDYARSFMTKKNQSEKLKEQIEASVLQKYFGYVEYDEEVDIQAIRQYEREFERFYKKHLRGLELSKDAVRFRKLGQHHAAGLYYPQVKCLCVDIHEPHSMIHELGHLIDYQFGSLSSQRAFSGIYEKAKLHIRNCMESDDALAKALKSKTKYNMRYYLTPTEVFARSFELYAAYILNEKSSLLKQQYEGIYDTSEENLKLIKEYFGANKK